MAKALLVLDVLNGIFELPVDLHDPEGFLSRTERLLASARRAGIPVVHVQHAGPTGSPIEKGTRGGQIHPRVAPAPGEIVVEKHEPDAFHGSTLSSVLDELGARELLVCGFASEACIDTTVRSAYGRGYAVTLVADCHTTTANAILSAAQIIDHHNVVLSGSRRSNRWTSSSSRNPSLKSERTIVQLVRS